MPKRTRAIPPAPMPSVTAPPMPLAGRHSYCSLPQTATRSFGLGVGPLRARLILANATKWVNGTVLRYWFFDQPTDGTNVQLEDGRTEWRPWTTTEAEQNVVRRAFDIWKNVGIGLEFREVSSRNDAEIRIGFMRGDGTWSYIGREILQHGPDERTMNCGWDLMQNPSEIDTAIHEIGHTLGFPHEHQNPNAGIVWDEEAVYTALAQPPNSWDREKTHYNIIRKIAPDTIQGSSWDPNSIMHYPFDPGLIKAPEQYRAGLQPHGGLSERDKAWVRTFYPPLTDQDYTDLQLQQLVQLAIPAGQQRNFVLRPPQSRQYDIATFGAADTVMVLSEDVNGDLKFVAADDNSGQDNNAQLRVRMLAAHKYVLRVRLFFRDLADETAVKWW